MIEQISGKPESGVGNLSIQRPRNVTTQMMRDLRTEASEPFFIVSSL